MAPDRRTNIDDLIGLGRKDLPRALDELDKRFSGIEVDEKQRLIRKLIFSVTEAKDRVPRVLWSRKDRNLLIAAVENVPEGCLNAFDYFYLYHHEPWAIDILEAAAEKNPWAAFTAGCRTENRPYPSIAILEGILLKAAAKNPRIAFEFREEYEDLPWYDAILRAAVEKDMELALAYLEIDPEDSRLQEIINRVRN